MKQSSSPHKEKPSLAEVVGSTAIGIIVGGLGVLFLGAIYMVHDLL